jgi:hypothetical protein
LSWLISALWSGWRGLGLEAPRPGRKTWAPFQVVGEKLFGEGFAGIIAPSAARPQGADQLHFRSRHLASRWLPANQGDRDQRGASATNRNDHVIDSAVGNQATRPSAGGGKLGGMDAWNILLPFASTLLGGGVTYVANVRLRRRT